MKKLEPIISANEMFYCSVPVPAINAHKGSEFDFTAAQIAAYGQSQTHPSIVYIPEGWNGHKYWLATTPYPFATDVFENPCIYYGDEDANGNPPRVFTPISGTVNGDYVMVNNPVVKVFSAGYINSDPDLWFDSTTQTMYLISRFNNVAGHPTFVQSSLDGQSWTQRSYDIVDSIINGNDMYGGNGQPSLIKIGDKFLTYYTGAGLSKPDEVTGARFSQVSIIKGNSLSLPTTFAFDKLSYMGGKQTIFPYHSDVFVDSRTGYYYMIFCGYNKDISGSVMYVYLAESTDGYNWKIFARPLLGNCSKASAYYRPTAFIRPSDRLLVIYWSTTAGIIKPADQYPNGASDIPVDDRTIGVSYLQFGSVLAQLKIDNTTDIND